MNILAFAASNSSTSINKRFATHAAEVFRVGQSSGAETEIIDLNDYEMPIYSPDRQKAGGIPPQAQAFYDRIGAADGLIVSFAEYNGSYTAAFKNIFDWASRISMKIYQDKPMVMLATSIGPRGGQNVLRTAVESAPFFGGDVKGSLSVGPYSDRFDVETGRLTLPDDVLALRDALAALRAALPAPA